MGGSQTEIMPRMVVSARPGVNLLSLIEYVAAGASWVRMESRGSDNLPCELPTASPRELWSRFLFLTYWLDTSFKEVRERRSLPLLTAPTVAALPQLQERTQRYSQNDTL
jgi:hypothetical protein